MQWTTVNMAGNSIHAYSKKLLKEYSPFHFDSESWDEKLSVDFHPFIGGFDNVQTALFN